MATLGFERVSAGVYHRRDLRGHTAIITKKAHLQWVGAIFEGYADEITKDSKAVVIVHGEGMRAVAQHLNTEAHNIKVKVKNLMSGKEVEESITTPHSCSVASETYWSS